MQNIILKNIQVSDHGRERLLERTACKAKNIESFLTNIWTSGKTINSYLNNPALKKYLINVCGAGCKDRTVRVKGNTLFLFDRIGSRFITCYPIPNKVLQDNKHSKYGV